MIKKITTITLFFLFAYLSNGQGFEAKIIAAFSASQVDGDGLGGYHQLGGVGGIATSFELNEAMSLQQEILYYGRGSRASTTQALSGNFYKIDLHYVDLNLIINYKITDEIVAQGGLGYGILFHINSDYNFDNQADNYRNDIFATLGGGYYITENIIGTVRVQYSALSMFKFSPAYNNTMRFGLTFILGN